MKPLKKKIGRNDLCPCGSGKKFKRCHGDARRADSLHAQVHAHLESHKARESVRQSQQGFGRPIISTEFKGYRVTAVGNRLHYSKSHKTFIDFLGDYIKSALGSEWGNAEMAKPLEERHQILKWFNAVHALRTAGTPDPNTGLVATPAVGVMTAYLSLAYNLYLLQHNVELQDLLLKRLRNSESFYPAYYESFVAAWFILAGFSLQLEDEADSNSTHVEFIATRNGQTYSVEAKARTPDKEHLAIGNQLYKALKKESKHQRIVFIDLNMSDLGDHDEACKALLSSIRQKEIDLKIDGEPAPPSLIFLTNQPYHLHLNETRVERFCVPMGFKVSDFGYGSPFGSLTEQYKAKKKYSLLYDVVKALGAYKLPVSFDGELPEFSFGGAKRRFNIGQPVEVGEGTSMTLISGVVSENEKKAWLVLSDTEGGNHVFVISLSDDEISAYKSHPETFFGRLQNVQKSTEGPLEFFEFIVDGFSEASRERLLELMMKAPDIEVLRGLNKEELLYAYAERLTYSEMRRRGEILQS